MDINIKIGEFCELVQEFKQVLLNSNQEIDISDLDCLVPTPEGQARINYIIKKENLEGIKIILDNNIEIKCAKKHILLCCGQDIYAENVKVGDQIDTKSGSRTIINIEPIVDSTYYDIGIDYPHLYYDSDGILHHNTIITATLSKSCEQYGRTIVIVPNKDLVRQTFQDYKNIGLDVGVYFGDNKQIDRKHTICTWQSLNNLFKLDKPENQTNSDILLKDQICIIVDEVHSAKAEVLKSMLSGPFANIPLRWGLTGTIPKEPYDFIIIRTTLGEVVHRIGASVLQDKGVLANCHVHIMQLEDDVEFRNYQEELKYLMTNTDRLEKIASLIKNANIDGNTLVLLDRLEAGKTLSSMIEGSIFLSGISKSDLRQEHYKEVASVDNKIIICTYGIAAVGINIPRIFNLVLIEPGKSFVRVIQSIGRGLRKAADKDFVQIFDITSNCKYAKRHLTKRKVFYKEASYDFTITKVPL